MFEPYTLLIPQNLNEMLDKLTGMVILSPKFEDVVGYFPGRNIDNTFYELGEGLRLLRPELGEELYFKLRNMSAQMRVYFEADYDKTTDNTRKGRDILLDMVDLLEQIEFERSAQQPAEAPAAK